MKVRGAAAIFVSFLLIAAACEDKAAVDRGAASDRAAAAAAVTAATPTDPDIAHVLQTFNAVTLRRASLARSKAQNSAVRRYADSMIAEHTALNARTMGWLHALNLVPVDNEHSRAINSAADEALVELERKSGPEFDRAYLDYEVTFHQRMVELLDDLLIPKAGSTALKSELEHARPIVGSHLERARTMQQSFVR